MRDSKKVLVAGGGVAGMEAAITASDCGHRVILCEKSDSLGGIILCERKVPFKKRIDSKNVNTADKVFENPQLVKEKTVILGAGLTGIELAIYLRELGRDVEIIEMGDPAELSEIYTVKLDECCMGVKYNTKAREITQEGVLCDTSEGERFIKADTIILALGMRPLWDEAERLSVCAGEFHQIGDCRQPGNIIAATGEAWSIAKSIGRL